MDFDGTEKLKEFAEYLPNFNCDLDPNEYRQMIKKYEDAADEMRIRSFIS